MGRERLCLPVLGGDAGHVMKKDGTCKQPTLAISSFVLELNDSELRRNIRFLFHREYCFFLLCLQIAKIRNILILAKNN